MKNLLAILLFFSSATNAQNWDLFPLHQKSYYITNWQQPDKEARLYVMDSIAVNGSMTTQYFRRKLDIEGSPQCTDDIINYNNYRYDGLYGGLIDSIQISGDTVFYFEPFTSGVFYFLPQADTGDQWHIISNYPGNDYDTITIQCISKNIGNVFGNTDSIKVYSLTPSGSTPGQVPVSNFQIRLSKNYGLLEFVPFHMFLHHSSFFSMNLIGFTDSISYGYQSPSFDDFFHLSAGDILVWEYKFLPGLPVPDFTLYHRDSITNVQVTPDSITYTYDRRTVDELNVIHQQFGQIESYSEREFGDFTESAPDWPVTGITRFNPWNLLPQDYLIIWEKWNLMLKIDSVTGDTITSVKFDNNATNTVDTTICQVWTSNAGGSSFTIDTRHGLNGYEFFDGDWRLVQLIGSVISGQSSGNINLGLGEINSNTRLRLYPNPVESILTIDQDHDVIRKVSIITMEGIVVKEFTQVEKTIPVYDLPAGMYVLQLQGQSGITSARFVKR